MMDSGRSATGEQELKEPKRKKRVPGDLPCNPFPIIFWKKIGIPPCADLWPCYNGFYDGEGVVFPSPEDICDIHSMGCFGRNVLGGRDSSLNGIPVVRKRQWLRMAKWATDFGLKIVRTDGSEDAGKDNVVAVEEEEKKGEFTCKESSTRKEIERFDLGEKDVILESNVNSIDEEDIIITADNTVKGPENSDVDETEKQISEEEMEEIRTHGEENKVRVEKECSNEVTTEEDDKENTVRKDLKNERVGELDSGKSTVGGKDMGTKVLEEEEISNEKEEEEMEVVEEILNEENPGLINNKKDSILSSGESIKENPNEVGGAGDAMRIVSSSVLAEERTVDSETEVDGKDLVIVEESPEKKKEDNVNDCVGMNEERNEALENDNNSDRVEKNLVKRCFDGSSWNNKGKRTKIDVLECEENVIVDNSSSLKTKDDTDVRKCLSEVVDNSEECEILEINYESDELREPSSEIDDDVIVVSDDDDELPVGKSHNVLTNNEGRRTCNKSMRKSGLIEIDLRGNEAVEVEKDTWKCKDVEVLYQKGSCVNNFNNIEDDGSTVCSSESDAEILPCIVIPDSDSDNETERGPVLDSDPSLSLPSLKWLKIFPEEAFFLAYALGCVQVWDGRMIEEEIFHMERKENLKQHDANSGSMSLEELWNAFRLSRSSQSSIPFETSYAVYHHFRSKGWVVKPGIRFGGDFCEYLQIRDLCKLR